MRGQFSPAIGKEQASSMAIPRVQAASLAPACGLGSGMGCSLSRPLRQGVRMLLGGVHPCCLWMLLGRQSQARRSCRWVVDAVVGDEQGSGDRDIPGWLAAPQKGVCLGRGLRVRWRWSNSWSCTVPGKVPTEVPCPTPWPNTAPAAPWPHPTRAVPRLGVGINPAPAKSTRYTVRAATRGPCLSLWMLACPRAGRCSSTGMGGREKAGPTQGWGQQKESQGSQRGLRPGHGAAQGRWWCPPCPNPLPLGR